MLFISKLWVDLKDAESLLLDNFLISNEERVRVNKWAATAMLARVYLYLENWSSAEASSTSVLNNTRTV